MCAADVSHRNRVAWLVVHTDRIGKRRPGVRRVNVVQIAVRGVAGKVDEMQRPLLVERHLGLDAAVWNAQQRHLSLCARRLCRAAAHHHRSTQDSAHERDECRITFASSHRAHDKALAASVSPRFVDANLGLLGAAMRHREIQAILFRDEQRRPRTGGGRHMGHATEAVAVLLLKDVDEAFAAADV